VGWLVVFLQKFEVPCGFGMLPPTESVFLLEVCYMFNEISYGENMTEKISVIYVPSLELVRNCSLGIPIPKNEMKGLEKFN